MSDPPSGAGGQWNTVNAGGPSRLELLVDWAVVDDRVEPTVEGPFRIAALASLAVATAAYLTVMYDIVAVVGGIFLFVAVAGGSLFLGVFLGATLRRRVAVLAALALVGLGLLIYFAALSPEARAVFTPANVLRDTVALLTGYSALQLVRAGLWTIALTPGPTFLVWFFAVRGEHTAGAAIAGLMLGLFVLTGDAGVTLTLVGVLAIAAATAFGVLARLGGGSAEIEVIAATFGVVILASAVVTAVPGGGGSPLTFDGGGVQADLVSAEDSVGVGGSLRLSPEVQFTVQADRGRYWRVAAYDRFTGSEWIQTGTSTERVRGQISDPPGDRTELVQQYEAKSPMTVLPAAAEPVQISGVRAEVDQLNSLQPSNTLTPGDTYAVTSLVVDPSPSELAAAGTDYPAEIRETYLQVPSNTPDRVEALTDNVTQTANNPYEAALAIERYLEANKEYSLTVPDPSGNLAAQFLFEMDEGYCVYYATTMVTMLRSQGIPARYVVGYTSGQQVGADEYVVRGLDSHAWVEVYFPDIGWVRFDPTPAEPRREAERARLDEARAAGNPNVDVSDSAQGTYTPTTTGAPVTIGTINLPNNRTAGPFPTGPRQTPPDAVITDPGRLPNATVDPVEESPQSGDGGIVPTRLPPLETLGVWSVLLVGLGAGARRSGLTNRAYRAVWVRLRPRGDTPTAVIESGFDRAMYVTGRRHGPRERGETVREYLRRIDVDGPLDALAGLRERARHGGRATDEMAAEARRLTGEIVNRR